jgi:hypothetical protein
VMKKKCQGMAIKPRKGMPQRKPPFPYLLGKGDNGPCPSATTFLRCKTPTLGNFRFG